ncbi:hypothetical protein DL98DRAFT_436236 [Cadophora sp. DSE1049]|nr:hypothetical protein DL98DRAFT_436236 [Cadophora sp. DSE1049]
MPTVSCWPSETDWNSLNQTLSGRLIRTVAPASVCYPSEPNYDEAACDTVLAGWSKSSFHSADPASVASGWSNNTCNPIYSNGTSIAGVQDGELYDAMKRNDAVSVGGTNLDVGVVGWAAGGGHGFLTGQYGTGADNILEAVVVTPNGDILTVNSCQNEDMFWAIRGGGGGTFGIILGITIKAYPMPTMQLWGLTIIAKNETSQRDWWKLVAHLHSLLPPIQDQGLKGYYTISGPPSSSALTFSGSFFLWNKPNGTLETIAAPIQQMLLAANRTATFSITRVPVSGFYDLLSLLPDTENVGTITSIVASRLISRRAVSAGNLDLLASTLEEVGPKAVAPSDGTPNLSVSGTMNISKQKVDNALNPAWRDAVVHFITSQSWKDSLPSSQVQQIVDDMTYNKLNALHQLAPKSGAYLNEANPFEPGWQWSFFGPNYMRLQQIKNKYDSDGVLWCRQCVGSENWIQGEDCSLCRQYQPY